MKIKYGIFLLPVILIGCFANAQFRQGMRMTGTGIGNTFFISGRSDYSFPAPTSGYSSHDNSYGVILNPSVGWFIRPNTVFGALFSLSYRYRKVFDETSGITFSRNISKTFGLAAGGFVRNYFSSSGSLLPFGEFRFTIGTGSSTQEGFRYVNSAIPAYKDTYDGNSSGDFSVNSGLSLGITKMLNANVGIDLAGVYYFTYNKNTSKTTTRRDIDINGSIDQTLMSEPTQKLISHGVSLEAGFRIFLDKRKKK